MTLSPETERQLRELSFLHEVAQLASSARDWDEMLRIVIDRTTDAMAVEVSSLYLLERREGILRLVATNGLNRRFIGKATLRVGEGITGWVANARVPAAARAVRADPRFKWIPGVDEERFRSMLSVPLLIHEEIVGVVNVQSVAERSFEKGEIEFLQTIANQVAGIIEKGRLQREAERKLREVSALFEVSNVLTSTLDLDEVLSLIVDRLVRVYPGSAGIIVLRDGDGLRERARSGDSGKTTTQAAQRAVTEARPIVSGHHIAVPLLAGERLLGAVALKIPEGTEMMEAEEVSFVGALANQAALAIDKAALYAVERETTASLRELERARSEFVAVVTHDLRTPLSVIRGYLDLIGEQNGHSKVPIDEAVAQVGHLDQLVDRILTGVRSGQPELPRRRARFDLRVLVMTTLAELAPVARRHRLVAPRAGKPLWVRADRRQVSKVLAGLVHNATKYAPEKTRIAVRLEPKPDRVIVRVGDEGPGVPPNERPRMFEPYARGDHNDIPGSGIGLFASRRVIESEGGDIWYEEGSKGGATFAFSVPRIRERNR
ncbi:MAG TPA: GAF domain-containing protein [Candidatus Limnocylindrales bacterium]|nr:GAF domain-containing protein [Candidatus Limnocylindrales bacterium]